MKSEDAIEEKKKKTDFSKEKDQGLHGWFSRQGGKGKSKGWVDCNTCRKDKKTGRKTCKSCGRQDGEKRKYPSCRPTPSDCGTKGDYGKKSKKSKKNESVDRDLLKKIILEVLAEETKDKYGTEVEDKNKASLKKGVAELEEVIEKSGSQWCVKSEKKGKDGKRKNLGCYSSKAAAKKRLGQIEYFKHQGE